MNLGKDIDIDINIDSSINNDIEDFEIEEKEMHIEKIKILVELK